MAKVLLLHGKMLPADAQIALDLIARRRDARAIALHDDHPLLIARSLPSIRRHNAEIIHAFGRAALSAAILAGPRRLVFTPTRAPGTTDVAWLRAALRYRPIDVICSSDTLRRYYVTRGLNAERCRLVRPGVPMSPAADRAALRERLQFSDDDRVIFAPYEVTHDSGHLVAMWATSLLNIIDPRYKLLVWGRGPASALIGDFKHRLLDQAMIRIGTDTDATLTPRALFAAADAALLTVGAFGQPAMTALAMASGKPIVAIPTPAMCEMVEDRHTALLCAGPTPRLVAQRVLDLFEDKADDGAESIALRNKLADRARAEAYDYFAESKSLAALDAIYLGG